MDTHVKGLTAAQRADFDAMVRADLEAGFLPEEFPEEEDGVHRSRFILDGGNQCIGAFVLQFLWGSVTLKRVFVAPARRGEGIGRRIVERVARDHVGIVDVLHVQWTRRTSGYWMSLGFEPEPSAYDDMGCLAFGAGPR
jgi:GNAT superfamily N-acetyltransferase